MMLRRSKAVAGLFAIVIAGCLSGRGSSQQPPPTTPLTLPDAIQEAQTPRPADHVGQSTARDGSQPQADQVQVQGVHGGPREGLGDPDGIASGPQGQEAGKRDDVPQPPS